MSHRIAVDVRVDDLAFFEGDAIARPVTALLGATTPVMRRLEVAAGPRLADQLRIAEPLPVGSAIVTGAGDLAVELLIHGVVQSETERVTPDGVRRALRSVMRRLVDWELGTVGIAPFGLGAGNLDLEESAQLTAEVIVDHAATRAAFPNALIIVPETADEAEIFRHCMHHRGL